MKHEDKKVNVKIYHGYGHTHNLVVYGHAFKNRSHTRHKFTNNILYNIIYLLRLFFVKPFPRADIRLLWQQQELKTVCEDDGFFKFEWNSEEHITAGWHFVTAALLNKNDETVTTGRGGIFVPHKTQFAFISDIDDTIMISHSATIARRLKELFINNPRTRSIFPQVAEHYDALAMAHTTADTPNPFFYVSSSEWNLYDYLNEFFTFHHLPQGAFLLNQIKRWYELWKTGKTKHEGKLLRVMRIINTFPLQQFVLFGDNTQSDPSIYASIAQKFPEKIFAVYIRNVVKKNEDSTRKILNVLEENNIHTCLFNESMEAIQHSKKIGLIE